VAERSKLDIERYVNKFAETVARPDQPRLEQASVSLESALKGRALELWSNAAGHLFIVADEEDARRLGERRGIVYTAAELRRVTRISDPAIVLEIHEWKQKFDGRIRESGA